jgi:hypothetical protein
MLLSTPFLFVRYYSTIIPNDSAILLTVSLYLAYSTAK